MIQGNENIREGHVFWSVQIGESLDVRGEACGNRGVRIRRLKNVGDEAEDVLAVDGVVLEALAEDGEVDDDANLEVLRDEGGVHQLDGWVGGEVAVRDGGDQVEGVVLFDLVVGRRVGAIPVAGAGEGNEEELALAEGKGRVGDGEVGGPGDHGAADAEEVADGGEVDGEGYLGGFGTVQRVGLAWVDAPIGGAAHAVGELGRRHLALCLWKQEGEAEKEKGRDGWDQRWAGVGSCPHLLASLSLRPVEANYRYKRRGEICERRRGVCLRSWQAFVVPQYTRWSNLLTLQQSLYVFSSAGAGNLTIHVTVTPTNSVF